MQAPPNELSHLRAFPDASFTAVVSPNADTLYSTALLDVAARAGRAARPGQRRAATTCCRCCPPGRTCSPRPARARRATARARSRSSARAGRASCRPGVQEIRVADVAGLDDRAHADERQGRLRGRAPLPGRALARCRSRPGAARYRPPAAAPGRPERRRDDSAPGPGGGDGRGDLLRPAGDADGRQPAGRGRRAGARAVRGDRARARLVRAEPRARGGARRGHATAALSELEAIAGGSGEPAAGWSVHRGLGAYGTDYVKRASSRWSASARTSTRTPSTRTRATDGAGRVPGRRQPIRLHFDAGQTPPARAFWSLTMYDERPVLRRQPARPLRDRRPRPARVNADGSPRPLAPARVAGTGARVELAARAGRPFNVILRIYWPTDEVLESGWMPPRIERLA